MWIDLGFERKDGESCDNGEKKRILSRTSCYKQTKNNGLTCATSFFQSDKGAVKWLQRGVEASYTYEWPTRGETKVVGGGFIPTINHD